ncbi:MAG TPA: hypothetical protein VGX76_09285, partial [Pirellulales bacterium]|nr:hypothetical protein [Pirellulales bacterium]
MVKSDNPANAPPHPVQAEVQAAATASHQEVTPTDFQSYNFCVLQFLSAAYAIRELGPDAQPDAVKSAATLLLSWRTDYFSLMHRDEVFEIFMMLAGSRNSIAHGQAFDFAAR